MDKDETVELWEKIRAREELEKRGYTREACKSCNGLGYFANAQLECSSCGGKGWRWQAPLTC